MRWLGRGFRSLFYPDLPPDPLGILDDKVGEHFERLRMLENRVAITEEVLTTLCEALGKEDSTRSAVTSAANALDEKAAYWDGRIEDRAENFLGDDVSKPAAALAGGLSLWATGLRMMTKR